MTDSELPPLYDVVVCTLHRINEQGYAQKREFDAVGTPGHIQLIDTVTKHPVLLEGMLLTRREDHEVGMNPGALFAVTESDRPFPIFTRTDDGRFEVDECTLVTDIQMTLWRRT